MATAEGGHPLVYWETSIVSKCVQIPHFFAWFLFSVFNMNGGIPFFFKQMSVHHVYSVDHGCRFPGVEVGVRVRDHECSVFDPPKESQHKLLETHRFKKITEASFHQIMPSLMKTSQKALII